MAHETRSHIIIIIIIIIIICRPTIIFIITGTIRRYFAIANLARMTHDQVKTKSL
jgi:hypothetical protein